MGSGANTQIWQAVMLYKTRCESDVHFDDDVIRPLTGWRAELLERLNSVWGNHSKHLTRYCHAPVSLREGLPADLKKCHGSPVMTLDDHETRLYEFDKGLVEHLEYGVSVYRTVRRITGLDPKQSKLLHEPWANSGDCAFAWVDAKVYPHIIDMLATSVIARDCVHPHTDFTPVLNIAHPLDYAISMWPQWLWDIMGGSIFTTSGIGMDIFDTYIPLTHAPSVGSQDLRGRFLSSGYVFPNPGFPTVWFSNEAEALDFTFRLEDAIRDA